MSRCSTQSLQPPRGVCTTHGVTHMVLLPGGLLLQLHPTMQKSYRAWRSSRQTTLRSTTATRLCTANQQTCPTALAASSRWGWEGAKTSLLPPARLLLRSRPLGLSVRRPGSLLGLPLCRDELPETAIKLGTDLLLADEAVVVCCQEPQHPPLQAFGHPVWQAAACMSNPIKTQEQALRDMWRCAGYTQITCTCHARETHQPTGSTMFMFPRIMA